MPKQSQTPPRYPNHLREYIHHNGLTLTELAQETAIPLRTLSDYCAGKVHIPRQRLDQLAQCIGCTPDEIVPKYEVSEAETEHKTFYWNVPYPRNPFFTGQDQLLQQLHDAFLDKSAGGKQVQALSGLGGVGKTHLALEYAYRYHHLYDAIFWIKADTQENLLADFLRIAQHLNLPEQHAEEQNITIRAVLCWLETHARWLLIFDNADDVTFLAAFMPPTFDGHTLLTTRAQAVNRLAHKVVVECMSVETGALLLLRRAGLLTTHMSLQQASAHDRLIASQIVEELGGLPLAIDQVGAYIEETAYHLEGYLTLYHKQRAALLQRRGNLATDHAAPVAATWTLAFERIEQSDPLAISLLRLCAFLDPDAIPEEILKEGLQECVPSAGLPIDELRLNAAIEALLRFSLIQRNTEAHTLTIHRLVQAVIQDTMDEETRRLWAMKAASAVKGAFPHNSSVYSASGRPHHAVQLLKTSLYLDAKQEDNAELATTLWNLAVQQQVVGKLLASEKYLKDCIALCRQTNDSFNEGKAHQYLALLKAYQGVFEDSIKHLDMAISLLKDTPATGIVWAYRALCLLLAKDIPSATIAAKQAYQLAKLQQNERDIIRSEWILGWSLVCHNTYQYKSSSESLQDATFYLEDAFTRCCDTNTVDYKADILLAQARLYFAQNNRERAKQCVTEALEITRHSSFRLLRADILNFLALLEIEEGNWNTAEKYVLAAFEDAECDGVPYSYILATKQAKDLLSQIQRRSSK